MFLGNFAIFSSWLFVFQLAVGHRTKLGLKSAASRLHVFWVTHKNITPHAVILTFGAAGDVKD